MFIKLLTIFSVLASLASAASLDDRRKKIVQVIDEELAEAKRLSEQVKAKNPDLLLRMSELCLEKARLWRESENEDYLAIPVEQINGFFVLAKAITKS